MKVNLINSVSFATDFLQQYMLGGFGSMNKTDVEILVFHLLRKYSSLNGIKSQQDLSLALRIPVSKISRLCYESNLRYGDDSNREQTFKDSLIPILMEAHFNVENNRVRFAVEDKFIRLQLQAKMKEIHGFADSSFNSEVVSISIPDFVEFYSTVFPEDAKMLEVAVNKATKESKNPKSSFAEKLSSYLKQLSTDGSIQVISGITLQFVLKALQLL